MLKRMSDRSVKSANVLCRSAAQHLPLFQPELCSPGERVGLVGGVSRVTLARGGVASGRDFWRHTAALEERFTTIETEKRNP